MQDQIWQLYDDINGHVDSYYTNATEEQQQYLRESTQGLLKTQQLDISFVKSDGAERTMCATLLPDALPKQEKDKSPRKYNPDICVVWDTEKQEWRSFRWDRVRQIKLHG